MSTESAAASSSTGPRGNYARGRERRDAIVQAAISLFGEVGFHGASLRDIAARAGISHPGLLHHFPTKADLLAAVLVHRDDVDGAAASADREQGRDWLDTGLRIIERNTHRRAIVEMFVVLSAEATAPEHPAHDYYLARYRSLVEHTTQEFESWARQGRLRDGVDPAAAARTWVALQDGLQIQWLLSLDGPPEDRVDMVRDLEHYMRGIMREEPEPADGEQRPAPPPEQRAEAPAS